jgi:radical SAM superfamily enzyme YgiQ (UPF0313 family)
MKIALVNPPQPYLITPKTQVPLGLLYLSAIVKQNTLHTVDLKECSTMTVDDAADQMGPYDIYGFTSTSLDYGTQLLLSRKLRAKHGGLHVIGGPHASVMPEETLADGFDCVFVGEAELSFLKFLCQLQERSVQKKYQQRKLTDLNALPRPDRDSFPWVGGNVLTSGSKESVNIMASRGCPFNCAFCASETIWHRKLRWRYVDDVVAEIKECIDKYGTKVVRFSDDNMLSNRKWTERFCDLVKPLGIKWRLSVRVDAVEPNIIKQMAEAGCAELGLGCESFDPNVLHKLNKKITPEQSLRAIKVCHDAGIGARLLMMINTPGETYKRTVDLNQEALESVRGKFCYLSFKIFMPLPGTPIWDYPDDYHIKIISRDFSRYNFYVYQNDHGEAKTSFWSPIRIKGLTVDQQRENVEQTFARAKTFPEMADGKL